MSQKLFKILVLIILAIGFVTLGIILVRAKNKKDLALISTNLENPFGIASPNISIENNQVPAQNINNTTESNNVVPNPIDLGFVSVEDSPIFKKLSEEPVAGAAFVYIEREIKLPEEVSANLVEGYDFTGYPTLKFGDDRKEVVDLKTVLNRQDPTPALAIDNAFDTNLKNTVIDFQIKNKLTPDGVVGKGFYQKLNELQGIKPKSTKAPEKETIEFVRFVDRANGFVFDKTTKLNESVVKLTNTVVPWVYEAYFDSTKNNILLRYLKDNKVENIVSTIKKPDIQTAGNTVLGTLSSKPMSNRISFISPLGVSSKIFYMTKENSGADFISYDFKNNQTKKIWSSKFSDWIPELINENSVLLTPRASGLVPANSYILDIKNNSLKNIISNTNGLTTSISPNGKYVIFSSYENNELKTKILNVLNGQISGFSPVTLPEKCIWSKDSKFAYCGAPASVSRAIYPDDWYKGVLLFDDLLWKVDVEKNISKIILDKDKIKTPIDITRPIVNDNQSYFVFINKRDMNLYGIDLSRL